MKMFKMTIIKTVLTNLWVADGCSHSGPDGLHHGALLGRQQVVLHSFNKVVFTCTAVLY